MPPELRPSRPAPEGRRFRCSRCRRYKLAREFFRRLTARDGLSSLCRECSAEYLRAWRAAHAPGYRAWNRGYKRAYRRNEPWRGSIVGAAKRGPRGG